MDICLIFCVAIAAAHIVVVSVAVIICHIERQDNVSPNQTNLSESILYP